MLSADGKRPKESSLTEYLILGLAAAIGIIFILVASLGQGYWSKVLSDLGDALVIAALVGLFVEMRLVKAAVQRMEAIGTKTIEDIKGMVVRGLRKYLPTKLVDALELQVLDPSFLREDVHIFITLSHQIGGPHVRGSVFLKYYIRNLTAKNQPYVVRLNLDEESAMVEKASINGQEMNFSALPPGSTISRVANTLRFEHPVSIPSNSRVSVELAGYQIMSEEDVWPWYLVGVSDSAEMTVKYPQETLSVWLLPKHPVNERLADFKLTETSGIT